MPGLAKVRDSVLAHAAPAAGLDVVDLGCGSGQLTLELGPVARSVIAVDFSSSMLDLLEARAAVSGIPNIRTVLGPLQSFDLPAGTVDLIVTNYALHHLRHPEKAELLSRAARWLRPGGRVVIGDMMFALTGDPVGKRIIADKVAIFARRGPGGWWRIAKNAWHLVVSRRECPASLESWKAMLAAAGFEGIESERVVGEAAIVSARLPLR